MVYIGEYHGIYEYSSRPSWLSSHRLRLTSRNYFGRPQVREVGWNNHGKFAFFVYFIFLQQIMYILLASTAHVCNICNQRIFVHSVPSFHILAPICGWLLFDFHYSRNDSGSTLSASYLSNCLRLCQNIFMLKYIICFIRRLKRFEIVLFDCAHTNTHEYILQPWNLSTREWMICTAVGCDCRRNV